MLKLLAIIPIAYIVIFLLAPVSYIAAITLRDIGSSLNYIYIKIPPDGEIYRLYYLVDYRIIAFTGYDFGPIANTLILAMLVSVTVTSLSLVTAITSLSLKGYTRTLIGYVIPAIASIPTPLLSAYAIIHLFYRDFGLINKVIDLIFGFRLSFEGIIGVYLYQVLSFFPIAHLVMIIYIESIDRSYIESAYNLGGRSVNILSKIIIPLSKPSVIAVASLVFILSAEDLAGPLAFSRYNSARNVMSYMAYYDFISEYGYTISLRAIVYTTLLALIAIVLFLVSWRSIRLSYYPVLTPRRLYLELPSHIKFPLATVTLFITIFSAMPTIIVILYSITSGWFGREYPSSLTLSNYLIALSNSYYFRAALNTIIYTILASIMALTLSYMSVYSSFRVKSLLSPVADIVTIIPIVIPGIAVGIGYFSLYHSLFNGIHLLDPFFNPAIYLVLAYTARRITYSTRPLVASIRGIPMSLEEQAENLGARIHHILRTIIAPMTLRSALVASIIISMHIATEFSVSVVLAGGYGVSASHPAPLVPVIVNSLTYNPGSLHVMSSLLIITLALSVILTVIITTISIAIISGLRAFGVIGVILGRV